jgi:hypothetical protein
VTRQERALACAAGIVPTSVAGLALLLCGRPRTAWVIDLVTAAAYFAWILISGRGRCTR